MDEIAEEGIRSALALQGEGPARTAECKKFVTWLRDLVKEISDAKEFLEAVKGEVFIPDTAIMSSHLRVTSRTAGGFPLRSISPSAFTPAVGNRCIGAKVNGRIVR